MIRLAAIDHVVFGVADFDAALRFYTEVARRFAEGDGPSIYLTVPTATAWS